MEDLFKDKLDVMNSYETLEDIKNYLSRCNYGYDIYKEEATDDKLTICWDSRNGEDGLPYYLYKGGKKRGGMTFVGWYVLTFHILENRIYFEYYSAGSYEGILSSCFVKKDNNGNPVYSTIKNKIDVMSIEREWNDLLRIIVYRYILFSMIARIKHNHILDGDRGILYLTKKGKIIFTNLGNIL